MSTNSLHGGERGVEEDARNRAVEPVYHRWLGHIVVLNYSHGEAELTRGTFYDIASGQVEGREGAFLLQEAGSVGILVEKLILTAEGEEDLSGMRVFVPWAAIHSMYSLDEEDENELHAG